MVWTRVLSNRNIAARPGEVRNRLLKIGGSPEIYKLTCAARNLFASPASHGEFMLVFGRVLEDRDQTQRWEPKSIREGISDPHPH